MGSEHRPILKSLNDRHWVLIEGLYFLLPKYMLILMAIDADLYDHKWSPSSSRTFYCIIMNTIAISCHVRYNRVKKSFF